MIFQHTWQNETVLHQAYVDEGDVLIAEVTDGAILFRIMYHTILLVVQVMMNSHQYVMTFIKHF